MAKPCPLYDYLRVVAKKNQIAMDPTLLASRLASLPNEHAEVVQVLILHHNFLNGRKEAIPYRGRIITKAHGVQYNLGNIPQDLQGILIVYLNDI